MTETEEKSKNEIDDYSIYKYFKNHPGVFLTSVSAIIAAVSVILNALINIQEIKYLRYWGFDAARVEIHSSNQIYIFAVILVYSFGLYISQNILNTTFRTFFENTEFFYFNIAREKLYKRELRNGRKKDSQLNKRLTKIIRAVYKDDLWSFLGDIDKCEKASEKSQKSIIELKQDIKSYKKEIQKCIMICFLDILPAVIILQITVFVLVFVVTYISINGTDTFFSRFAGQFIVSLLISAFCIVVSFLFERAANKKYINTIYSKFLSGIEDSGSEELKEMMCTLSRKPNTKYSFNQFLKGDIKSAFGNRQIFQLILYLCLSLITIFFTLIVAFDSTSTDLKEFSVYSDDAHDYVIIYSSGNEYYMDRATISENEIEIDTTQHRTITSNDISYELISFENVSIIGKDNKDG